MSVKEAGIATEESRYGVVEVRRNHVHGERFVPSHRDQESLRELIAAPSILGIAFSSREAAVAVIPNSRSTDGDSKSIWEKHAFRREHDHRGPQLPTQQLLRRVGLTGTRPIAWATLRNAVVAGVLMFYSRSVLGAVIRAFVGA